MKKKEERGRGGGAEKGKKRKREGEKPSRGERALKCGTKPMFLRG